MRIKGSSQSLPTINLIMIPMSVSITINSATYFSLSVNRTKDNEWLPVCSSNWSTEWSHKTCQGLGFAKAQFTEMRPSESNSTPHFALKIDAHWDSGHRLTAAVSRSTEPCEAFVELTCQEFSKFFF